MKRSRSTNRTTIAAPLWAITLILVSLVAIVTAQTGYAHQARTYDRGHYQAIDKVRPKNGDRFEAPTLSGPEQTYDSARFRVPYTRSGKDAVPPLDRNVDGVPDYVEQVYQVEVNQMGWVAPPAMEILAATRSTTCI